MRPVYDMLSSAQGMVRFHMPGHKGRIAPPNPAYDMTELEKTDDLYAPELGIAEAERLLAKAAGAEASILLTGGSTSGMLAMILSCLYPGDRLLMKRNAHHSALSACVLGGVEPVFLPIDADLGKAVREIPADAVLVTRPDYFGRVDPLPDAKIPVLVDAAHGAHFNWWDSPAGAMRAGADFAVESAHKTLGAWTGGAWLHLRDAAQAPRVRQMLRMVMSSSPSYPIMQSLDDTRAWMDVNGREALAQLSSICQSVRMEINRIAGLRCENLGDPTRLYVECTDLGLSGWQAYDQLRKQGVELEMANARGVVAIATVYDRPEDFAALIQALKQLPEGPGHQEFPAPAYAKQAMPVREAALSPTKRIPLRDAAGTICARAVGAYPPGCAIAAPGEQFTDEVIAYLREMEALGARLFGADGGFVEVVKESWSNIYGHL